MAHIQQTEFRTVFIPATRKIAPTIPASRSAIQHVHVSRRSAGQTLPRPRLPRFEAFVVSVFLCIQHAMSMHNPTISPGCGDESGYGGAGFPSAPSSFSMVCIAPINRH